MITFGSFQLLPTERRLLKGGQPLHIGSRSLDILMVLVERAGEVVPRRVLFQRVWPDLVVEESSLRAHVAALRRILGDGQNGARYVVNVPGRGYCFVGRIARAGPPAESGNADVAELQYTKDRLSLLVCGSESEKSQGFAEHTQALARVPTDPRCNQLHRCSTLNTTNRTDEILSPQTDLVLHELSRVSGILGNAACQERIEAMADAVVVAVDCWRLAHRTLFRRPFSAREAALIGERLDVVWKEVESLMSAASHSVRDIPTDKRNTASVVTELGSRQRAGSRSACPVAAPTHGSRNPVGD